LLLLAKSRMSGLGFVLRVSPVQTAVCNVREMKEDPSGDAFPKTR
jgi:hypothetical protein